MQRAGRFRCGVEEVGTMTNRDPLSRGFAFIVEGAVFVCIVGALYAWSWLHARRSRTKP